VITGQETASPGETFTLSGADSTDPEDDPITGFEWILVDTGAPTPTLVGLDQEELEVTIPNDLMQTTEYRFELYVTDAFGLESLQPAQHTVTVNVMVDPDMGMDMGADMGGEPDMDTDMGGEPDMDTDMGGEPDMDVEDDMGGQADMGADMGPTPMDEDNGELQGSSCFCASVDHQQQAPPTWLLAVALGFLGLVRRRRRS
jgi:MYXO-CTERM domain-containing protein